MVLENISNRAREKLSKSSLKNQLTASTGKIVGMTSKSLSLRVKENKRRVRSKTADIKKNGISIELQDRRETLQNDMNIPFVTKSRKLAVRVCRSAKIDELLRKTKEISDDNKISVSKSSPNAEILKIKDKTTNVMFNTGGTKQISQSANLTYNKYPECTRKIITKSASIKVSASNASHSNENIKQDKERKTADIKKNASSIELKDRRETLHNDMNIQFVTKSRKLAVRVCRSAKIDEFLRKTKEISDDSKISVSKSSPNAEILKIKDKTTNVMFNTGGTKQISQSANLTYNKYPECTRKIITKSASIKVSASNANHSNENIKEDKERKTADIKKNASSIELKDRRETLHNDMNIQFVTKSRKLAVRVCRSAKIDELLRKTKQINDDSKISVSKSSLDAEILKTKDKTTRTKIGDSSCVMDGSSSLRNLSRRTDLIETLLMSDNADEEHIKQPIHKFFRTRALPDKNDKTSEKYHTSTRPKKPLQRIEENNNMYEFFSSSQNSPKTIDPAADVVQKLIDEGRAEMATHKKGSGKLVLKRIQNRKKINCKKNQPITENSAKNRKVRKNNDIVEPLGKRKKESINNDIINLDGVDDRSNDFNESMSSFNPLPGHVLLNEIIKNGPKRDYVKQRKLLDAVRNYISTPINKTMASSSTPKHFSPIYQNNSGNASPWRADDDLPQAFYFTGNSSNLPSFSSDYILSSPKKPRVRFEKVPNNEKSLSSPSNTKVSTSDKRSRPSLTHGSPLRPVNVISVEVLPPWRPMNSKENVEEVSPKRIMSEKNRNLLIRVGDSNFKSDLFGFKEYLNENDENVGSDTENAPTTNTKTMLKRKRLKLKKLKQAVESTKKTPHKPIKAVFDEGGDHPRQLKIMDMLCSTMINSPRCSKIVAEKPDQGTSEKTSTLFEDLEPETHFDKSNYGRTYTRKKRRKLSHHFSMFENSDESEEEEEDRSSVKTLLKHSKKIDERNGELENFVKEFNAMVLDVEKYELTIE